MATSISASGATWRSVNYNVSAPGVNTNILATGLTPIYPKSIGVGNEASVFRVTVVLATGSVFNYTVTNGTTAFTVGLNASAALNAGDEYVFDIPVHSTYTYNFQVETDGVIRILWVQEIVGNV